MAWKTPSVQGTSPPPPPIRECKVCTSMLKILSMRAFTIALGVARRRIRTFFMGKRTLFVLLHLRSSSGSTVRWTSGLAALFGGGDSVWSSPVCSRLSLVEIVASLPSLVNFWTAVSKAGNSLLRARAVVKALTSSRYSVFARFLFLSVVSRTFSLSW